jgi:hypothetical protein
MSHVQKTRPEMFVEKLVFQIEENLQLIQETAITEGDILPRKTIKLIIEIERIRKSQMKILNDLNRALGSYHFE